MGAKLSEFHTGYRAFSRQVLTTLPLLANSNDFLFDNQMLTQAIAFGFRVGEVSCPTKYFAEASSISFRRSLVYGLGVLGTSIAFRLWKWGLPSRLFAKSAAMRLDGKDGGDDSLDSFVCLHAVQEVTLNPSGEQGAPRTERGAAAMRERPRMQ
jgi:hypothetical protein